jgi:serine/threonine protein kinase
LLRKTNIVHADIKPDNILVSRFRDRNMGVHPNIIGHGEQGDAQSM